MTKTEKMLNLDLDCQIKEYSKRNNKKKIFILAPKELDFPSVVLHQSVEDNTELLSKMDSIFAERHSPNENTIFDVTERSVTYSFSLPDLLKILGRNQSVSSAGRLEDLFTTPEPEQING